MRQEFWNSRRDRIAPYSGKGASYADVAVELGLTWQTVKKYADKYGFEIGRVATLSESVQRDIAAYAGQDITRAEAAAQIGVSVRTLSDYARQAGLKFRHANKGRGVDKDRSDTIRAMYLAGKTLEEIGSLYKLTRERIRQILSNDHGIVGADGGQALKSKIRAQKLAAAKEVRCLEKYGCSRKQLRDLKKLSSELGKAGDRKSCSPIVAYATQKGSASSRGIEWNLKLWDWWTIWEQSGRWSERGRGHGYMMCRFGDAGAYEVGNVYIATGLHNSAVQPNNPYRKDHPDFGRVRARRQFAERNVDCHRVNVGLPKGVTIDKGRFQAQIGIDGRNKYIGRFATADEAHEAYLAAAKARDEARAA